MGIADQANGQLDFRELAETCPVAIFQVDASGRCTYANGCCAQLLNVADPLGTGWLEAVHPLDRAVAIAMWHRSYDSLAVERVLRIGRREGPVSHVRLRASPLPAPGGGVRGYCVTAVDITPSASSVERLESTNAFLARAEAITGVGGWRFDIRTRALLWTSNMRRIHELPDDYEPRGDEHVKYFPAEAREQFEAAVRQSIATGQPWDLVLPMRTARGREIWVHSCGEPERDDGRVVAVTGVLHDVTEERRRMEELRAARDAADTLNRAKTELLAIISHRVRTPLNGIVGNTQLLLLDAALAPQARTQVEQVASSAQSLLAVVEEVLGTEGIATGRLAKPGAVEASARQAAFDFAVTTPLGAVPRLLRVLVVEDNPINQAVAAGMLRHIGCGQVDVANHGGDAVRMATADAYDLILMDCQMPVMDGYEATRRLRAAGCRALIVAVTSTVVRGARERCLAAGMDEYVSKPINLDKLRWVVERGRTASASTPASDLGTALPSAAADLAAFRAQAPQLLARLAVAVATLERPRIGTLVQSLKRAALRAGADEVAADAGALADAAANGTPRQVSECFDRLARACALQLRQWPDAAAPPAATAALEAPSPAAGDPAGIPAALEAPSPAASDPAGIPAPPSTPVQALRGRCIEACKRCTTLCDAELQADTRYTAPGTQPYSALHLSLVACSSVCSIVASSVSTDLGNAVEMARWCADVCRACRDILLLPEPGQPPRDQVIVACEHCAQACSALADALAHAG